MKKSQTTPKLERLGFKSAGAMPPGAKDRLEKAAKEGKRD
jgi:hypothetical protein